VTIWQPQLNSALTDLKRITKALFDSAIHMGKMLTDAKQVLGEDVDWLAVLNVAISDHDEGFYVAFAKHCQAVADRLTPYADTMPLKVMALIDAAYHAAAERTVTSGVKRTA
jgi:hypothetical protein